MDADEDEDEEITFIRSAIIEERTEPRSIPRAIVERSAAPRHVDDAPTALNLPGSAPGSAPLTGEEDMRGFTRVVDMPDGPGKVRDPLPVARDPRLAFVRTPDPSDKTSVIDIEPSARQTTFERMDSGSEYVATRVLPGGGHPDYHPKPPVPSGPPDHEGGTQLLPPGTIGEQDVPTVDATALLDMPDIQSEPAPPLPRSPDGYHPLFGGPRHSPAVERTDTRAPAHPALAEPSSEERPLHPSSSSTSGRRPPVGRRSPSGRQRPAGRGDRLISGSNRPVPPARRPPPPGSGAVPMAATGGHPVVGGYPPPGVGYPASSGPNPVVGTGRHPALGPAPTGRHMAMRPPADENRRLAWGFLIGVVIAVTILAIGFVLGRFLLQ